MTNRQPYIAPEQREEYEKSSFKNEPAKVDKPAPAVKPAARKPAPAKKKASR